MVRIYFVLILSGILLAVGLWMAHQSFQPVSADVMAKRVSGNLKSELNLVSKDAQDILAILKKHPVSSLPLVHEYPFFVYERDSLIFWSDNSFVPPVRWVSTPFSIKLLKTSGGDYLARKWVIDEDHFLMALLPLYRDYTIQNDYLHPEWNHRIFEDENIDVLEPNALWGTPVYLGERLVFRVRFAQDNLSGHERTRWASVCAIMLSIVLLIIALYRGVYKLRVRYPDLSFLLLIAGLWAIRLVMTDADFPGIIVRFPLFDPQNFASSDLNRSLGDLLLNELALLAVCFYLFRNYYHFVSIKYIRRKRWLRMIFSVCAAGIFFFAWIFPFVVIQTIYNNSAIVLDISQSLQFDSLRITALLLMVISWLCTFLFAHVFIRSLVCMAPGKRSLLYLIAGAIIFVVINILSGQLYISTLWTGLLYFLVVVSMRFYRTLRKVRYSTFAYLFAAIIGITLNSTVTIHHFTRKEKIEAQFRFASNFLVDRDIFAEYLLREVSDKISNDLFIQSRITSPFLSKDAIRQKVRQVFLPSYFNKYDIDIMLFGPGGNPIHNRTPTTFRQLINLYDKEAFKTEYEDVYFISSPTSDVTQRYLIVSPIVKSGTTLGYVVLQLLLKKVIPDNVYPELLIDNRFQQFYRMQDISYAVYGKDLLYSSGSFNYERSFRRELLGNPDIHLRGIVHEGYVHVALEDGNNRAAVVSSPTTPWVYVMGNFSYLLVLGLSLLLIFVLVYGLVNVTKGHTLFFSARIQLVLNLAFFIPLIVVSITTLRLTSISSQEQLNSEYMDKSKLFGSQLEAELDKFLNSTDVNRVGFENQLTDLAKVFNLEANVYKPNGKLLASSQPLIFENGLIAPYIDPEAWRKMHYGENLFIATEQVGSLNYYVSFTLLKSPAKGDVIGVLGLPFFQSLTSIERIQIRVLTNILNVFAGVFMVLIVLSYLVSEWLTFPLRFITSSLSKTTLTKTNQPLRWRANDEIGMMVKEYNQMLYKLSESKAELEQTQRERAWREIAQQVAHEIKNPLTPMKLTLQKLERSIDEGTDTKDKVKKSLSSLLSQVDILNDIASSFSSFAKMPEPAIQRLELVQLLRRIADLHRQSGVINFKPATDQVFVQGDEQLLGRIFSNLILNAFQAARPGVLPVVDIKITLHGTMCRLTFQDNGKGINEKVADRVFVPYFSTKRSGSGLGLAIAKQGIEQMGGSISFESKTDEGTTFYIELPWSQEE